MSALADLQTRPAPVRPAFAVLAVPALSSARIGAGCVNVLVTDRQTKVCRSMAGRVRGFQGVPGDAARRGAAEEGGRRRKGERVGVGGVGGGGAPSAMTARSVIQIHLARIELATFSV